MRMNLLIITISLSLCFSLPAFANTPTGGGLRKAQTTFIDARITRLPASEFPEPLETSYGMHLAKL